MSTLNMSPGIIEALSKQNLSMMRLSVAMSPSCSEFELSLDQVECLSDLRDAGYSPRIEQDKILISPISSPSEDAIIADIKAQIQKEDLAHAQG